MGAGDFIVYYDETNFNVYCKRTQGRAAKEKRATVIHPPSKGANLQIQCAVSTEIYEKVKSCPTFDEHFRGKKVVIVLDNSPAHSQTEERVTEHDGLVLIRLAPYSPMCCFSVLEVKIKGDLALSREELVAAHPRGQLTALRMEILERAAKLNINYMGLRLVNKMALHCQHAVAAAKRIKDMQYGT
ncbi:hypothetical protein PR002_g9824 [Phytophthora rubi]|uniref:Tc1-like transposase DDE domain-containing protein n=1 Tax=Phytophthora rubi TaxID=129364 RepID=A0A6A3MN29_9STRA|nr:hypothetical protein PR002_g9824 [Phytophthora rubi]